MFQRKGQILIAKDKTDEDPLMEPVSEADAEDLKTDGEQFKVVTDPNDFLTASEAVTNAGIDKDESEITMIPDLIAEVTEPMQAESMMRFVDALEELDDARDVYTNFDIFDDVAAQFESK